MSETPQETLAAYLASPSSGALWEIGVREAIRALLAQLVEVEEMGRAWHESDEHKHADELRASSEAAWREVDLARAERDTLRDIERKHAVLVETIIGLRAKLEKAEAALGKLRWLGENWPGYWIVGPLWTNAKRYEAAIEAVKALRDTAPREEK